MDKAECYGSVCAADYCWTHITSTDLFDVTKGGPLPSTTGTGPVLPHKVFPVLMVCQALSLLLVLFLWRRCLAQDLVIVVQEIANYANDLTDRYRQHDEQGQQDPLQRTVNQTNLNIDLNNYLIYFAHVLNVKAPVIYFRHVGKWVVLLAACLAWFLGTLNLFLPKFDVFLDYAFCKHGTGTSVSGSTCYLPSSIFLKALWYLTLVILAATMGLVVFHLSFDLCRPQRYRNTFFHQMIPGAKDFRVERIVEMYYKACYVTLLSRHCWANAYLLTNSGLSEALTWRYSYYPTDTQNNQGWLPRPFPSLQPDQIEIFHRISLAYVRSGGQRSEGSCCRCTCGEFDVTPHYDYVIALPSSRPQGGTTNRSEFTTRREEPLHGPALHVQKRVTEPTEELARGDNLRRSQPQARNLGQNNLPRQGGMISSPRRVFNSPFVPTRDNEELDSSELDHPSAAEPQGARLGHDHVTYGVSISTRRQMASTSRHWR